MGRPEELMGLLDDGRQAYQTGDLVRAERLLSDALAHGADRYADVHHMLGVVYHSFGDFTKARGAFEEALKINPHYTEAALNLSITYNDLGRYAEAKEIYNRALPSPEVRIDPFTRGKISNLHAAVGDAYRSAGLSREAAVEYRRALGLSPGFVDIRMRLVHALADAGQLKEAIDEARVVLLDHPGHLPAYVHLGLLLHRTGDAEGARRVLGAALERDPTYERAAMYLRLLDPHAEPEPRV